MRLVDVDRETSRAFDLEEAKSWDWDDPETMRTIGDLQITRLVRGGGTASRRNPLDIAKERYAKGEISKEEFEQLKKDLT
jgi:hypothetical protein